MTWIGDDAIARLRALEDSPDLSGTRYELRDRIGRGGMGVVFRGWDRELDRDVAIKVTALQTAADAERLRAEARRLARLEHSAIVAVHDVGTLPDGRIFTVMALVAGQPLHRCLPQFSLADRLRIFDRICGAVAFAHRRGIAHGDLKPANVMVQASGQVLVVDWGGGTTEGYRAPESGVRPADTRADVFALGAILEDLLPPAPRPRFLRPLESIARQARATDAEARYPGADILAEDVRRFVDGAAVGAHHESLVERGARVVRAYRTPLALVAAYLVMRALFIWLAK